MSHKAIVVSPVGAPLVDRTIGELVAERSSSSRIFQNYGIDFCCQGGRTLAEACEIKDTSYSVLVPQAIALTQRNQN